MTDNVDRATRSRMMAGIKSKNTKPEVLIRQILHREGFRFRLHDATLPGKPDIVLPKYRAVVFVNGCFWHAHDCVYFKWPKTNSEWWKVKICNNVKNDALSHEKLLALGWRVAIVWECSLKKGSDYIASTKHILLTWLTGTALSLEIPS